jgi:hypothetical protein
MTAFSPTYEGVQEVDTQAVDPDYDYVMEHPNVGVMLSMNDWFEENWNRFVLPRREPIDPEEADTNQMNYISFDGTYYNVPNCYTCHSGNRVPPAALSPAVLNAMEAEGHTVLPPSLRGMEEE